MRACSTLATVFVLLVVASIAAAWSDGPPDGYAGNPPDLNTCINCHDTFGLNSGFGGVIIGFPYSSYEPSTPYDIPVVMGHEGREHWGYQLTVLDGDGNSAGFFVEHPTDGDLSVLSENDYPNPDFAGQSALGILPGEGFGFWNVRWIAPPTGTGLVTMFVTGMAADGDGTDANDYVYSFNLTVNEHNNGETGAIAFMLENRHEFGNVPLGSTRVWTERLYSTGTETIEIHAWDWLTDGPFTVLTPELPLSLTPGNVVDFSIEFEPAFNGSWSDSLDFGLPNTNGISGIFVHGNGTFALRPDPFHLLSPEDGAWVGGDSLRFTWEPSENPDSTDLTVLFDLEIDTESDFSTKTVYAIGADTTTLLPASEFEDAELYFWRVFARDTNTPGTHSTEEWAFVTDFTDVNENGSTALAVDPSLVRIYPNPFNEQVSITFSLPTPTVASVEILDLLGRRVAVLHSGPMDAGSQSLQWHPDCASGLYLLRIAAPGTAAVHQKMILLK